MVQFIDTHTHIDGEEFTEDLAETVQRAKDTGAVKLFVPGINASSVETIKTVCRQFTDYCYGMIGLHPEDVRADYAEVIAAMKGTLQADEAQHSGNGRPWIAIGEIGLDFYWSREFEAEQLAAFEMQVQWAIEARLPLMTHCRKAQNEMVRILRKYEGQFPGGVFHCFTGNTHEAEELLAFDGFALGIGGVLTFKKSNLPETLATAVPLNRIVLETDAPYMAPVPHRGKRNESAYIVHVIDKLAEVYGVTPGGSGTHYDRNGGKDFLLVIQCPYNIRSNGLKAQHYIAQGNGLKAQHYIAQGDGLGIYDSQTTPCKGKST